MIKEKNELDIEKFDVDEYLKMELLRFTTAGSVDDGKSTLIGRLLFDSKAIFQDQMDALEEASSLRGEEDVNLALLTDGLRAEREQGITIDVAYRYFSTPKRKFIIADTPGHEQYTRNMVTGASTADLAIILIDARYGILPQSRRHGIIASLLGIKHVIVAVNKMDIMDYSEDVFNKIKSDYVEFSKELDIQDITYIPISALIGDNVVDHGENMKWYTGKTVMDCLENTPIQNDKNFDDFRFPVQYVIRPHLDFRGFAGRVSSGSAKVGDSVTILPSMKQTTIKEIVTYEGNVEETFPGESVTLTLSEEIDLSRGDMIVHSNNVPHFTNQVQSMLCWMDDQIKLELNKTYLLQINSRIVKAFIKDLNYKLDINTFDKIDTTTLALNEIGCIEIETAFPIPIDPYQTNRETGSFILIDQGSNQTVAAGMILKGHEKTISTDNLKQRSSNVTWEKTVIEREDHEKLHKQKSHCIWLTGLHGSGKSTIAKKLEKKLFDMQKKVNLLDGDNIRHGISGDLGFSDSDRLENIRRTAHMAEIMFNSGSIVICALISPTPEMRNYARSLFPEDSFSEVFVKADIETCKKRDPKGLYEKALSGEINDFTGISSPYVEPETPELEIDTLSLDVDKSVDKLIDYLQEKGCL